MITNNVNSVVNVAVETPSTFQLRQIEVKSQNNETLFKLVQEAIERKPVQIIVTPRIDVAGHAYYWMGVRFDRQELNFKLKINEQIGRYILAYLKGDGELPTVTEFEPTKIVENPEEWLLEHRAFHSPSSIAFREELTMKDDVNYLTTKLNFLNGRIIYPATKCEDVLSVVMI